MQGKAEGCAWSQDCDTDPDFMSNAQINSPCVGFMEKDAEQPVFSTSMTYSESCRHHQPRRWRPRRRRARMPRLRMPEMGKGDDAVGAAHGDAREGESTTDADADAFACKG